MEHTKAALKRQTEPRWLLGVAVIVCLTLAYEYFKSDEPSPPPRTLSESTEQ